jgi:hypothetical protein
VKLVVKIAAGIILALVLLTAGCAALIGSAAEEATKEQAWSLTISAPAGAEWSGHVGDHSIQGVGSRTEEFTDMAITAAVVQKSTPGGWTLDVALYDESEAEIDSASTAAEYGVATVDGADF